MIPIVHLDDPDIVATASKVRAACIEYGFFYLATGQNNGISTTLLHDVLEQTRLLFHLPTRTKKCFTDSVLNRGYSGMEEETLDPMVQEKSGRGDTKEGYYIGHDIPITDERYDPTKLRGPNVWPNKQHLNLTNNTEMDNTNSNPNIEFDCDKFRTVMELYFHTVHDIGLRVVRLIALALQLPEDYFDPYFTGYQHSIAVLRLLHYAAVRSIPEEGLLACGAHSDYGMITMLVTDDTPGLQILTKENEWIHVAPVPDEVVSTTETTNTNKKKDDDEVYFIINLGDMLERWTNGLFRSTIHRVVTDGCKERYSIPYFFDPNFDTIVECIPTCCLTTTSNNESIAHTTATPLYPPIKSGQYLLDRYKQTHADFRPVE